MEFYLGSSFDFLDILLIFRVRCFSKLNKITRSTEIWDLIIRSIPHHFVCASLCTSAVLLVLVLLAYNWARSHFTQRCCLEGLLTKIIIYKIFTRLVNCWLIFELEMFIKVVTVQKKMFISGGLVLN